MSEKGKIQHEKEEDCRCFAESRNQKACPEFKRVTHPLRYYEFTQDEIRALEECDRESFYRRCVPFGAVLATGTYAAIKAGYLKKHPVFGVFPKVVSMMLAGHVLGRLMSMPDYENRLRELPSDSKLGNLIRSYHAQRNAPPSPKKKR